MVASIVGMTLSDGLRNFFSGKTKAEREKLRQERREQRKLERESRLVEKAELYRKIEDIRSGKKTASGSGIVRVSGGKIVEWVKNNPIIVVAVVVAVVAIMMLGSKRGVTRKRGLQLARARAIKAMKRKAK